MIAPAVLYGCGHKLLESPTAVRLVMKDHEGAELRSRPLARPGASHLGGIFVAASDFTDLPPAGRALGATKGDHGLPQCMGLTEAINAWFARSAPCDPLLLGFSAIPDGVDAPGTKMTFCLFPEMLVAPDEP